MPTPKASRDLRQEFFLLREDMKRLPGPCGRWFEDATASCSGTHRESVLNMSQSEKNER